MANPRQRRKARSSSHKPVSNPLCKKKKLKKNPPIRGPKVLRDAWDKHKTVRQNYTALGLVHSLDPSASGGAEPLEVHVQNDTFEGDDTASATCMGTSDTTTSVSGLSGIRGGFGKIVRDAQGNVVRVELPENDGMVEQDMEGSVQRRWVTSMGQAGGPVVQGEIIQALERLGTGSVTSRHSSAGELTYLQRLLTRHGTNVAAMAVDHGLNYEQRTEGELRRGLYRAGVGGEE